jgi:hypothetical protein
MRRVASAFTATHEFIHSIRTWFVGDIVRMRQLGGQQATDECPRIAGGGVTSTIECSHASSQQVGVNEADIARRAAALAILVGSGVNFHGDRSIDVRLRALSQMMNHSSMDHHRIASMQRDRDFIQQGIANLLRGVGALLSGREVGDPVDKSFGFVPELSVCVHHKRHEPRIVLLRHVTIFAFLLLLMDSEDAIDRVRGIVGRVGIGYHDIVEHFFNTERAFAVGTLEGFRAQPARLGSDGCPTTLCHSRNGLDNRVVPLAAFDWNDAGTGQVVTP